MNGKGDWVALASLAALAAWLLSPALFGGQAPYYRDIAAADVPGLAFFFGATLRGELPIWNPLSDGGYPQLGGLAPPFFYPLLLAFLPAAGGWLGWGQAVAAYLWLHYALAGAFTYALGRHWGWGRPAATSAAIAFMLSGYMVSLANVYTNLPAAALLPLVTLLWDRALAAGTRRATGLAAAGLALQVCCGRPDVSLMTAWWLLGYTCWRAGGAAALPGALARLAAAWALAALANAAMLLPALEFVAWSNRATGIPAAESLQFPFSPLRAVELVLPGFFGDTEQGTDWGRYFVGEPQAGFSSYFLTLYGGVTAYLAALCARSPRRQRGLTQLLAIVLALALLLALGPRTPAYGWFLHLPFSGYVRFPSKFFLLASWALALLAGLGVGAAPGLGAGRRALVAAAAAAGGLGLLAMWLGESAAQALFTGAAFGTWAVPGAPAGLDATMHFLLPGIYHQALATGLAVWLLAAACATACWLARRQPRWAWALAALLAVDLAGHNAPAVYYMDAGLYRWVPPLVARLRAEPGEPATRVAAPYGSTVSLAFRGGLARAIAAIDEPFTAHQTRGILAQLGFNANLLYGQPVTWVYGSLLPRYSPAATLAALFPRRDNDLAVGGGDTRLDGYTRVAGAADAGFLLVRALPPAAGKAPELPNLRANPNLTLAWEDGHGLFLYRNLHRLPRAYVVPDAVVVPDERAALAAVAEQAGRLARLVVVVQGDALAETLRQRQALPGSAPGRERRCQITSYGATRVIAQVDSPDSGFLVLSDNHYPGWEADVDGQARPILLANGFGRAVYVQAGAHTVTFRYRPHALFAGLALSLAALAAIGWLAGGRRPRGSR